MEFLLGPLAPLPHRITTTATATTTVRKEAEGQDGASAQSGKRNQTQVRPQVDSGTFLDEVKNITLCTGNRQRSFLREVMPVGRQTVRSALGEELPVERTQGLGGLEEGVGSEDGGDNLASGVDRAFAV